MQPSDVSASVSSKNGSASQNGIGPTGSETPPLELPVDRVPEPHSSSSSAERDPYVGVVLVLLAASIVGLVTALEAGLRLGNPILIDTAVTLGLAAGILIGIARAQLGLLRRPKPAPVSSIGEPPPAAQTPPQELAPLEVALARSIAHLHDFLVRAQQKAQQIGYMRLATGAAGLTAVCYVLRHSYHPPVPTPTWAAIVAGLSVVAAGLAATAVHYLTRVNRAQFPESPALSRGARVIAWLLLLTAVSIGLAWRAPAFNLDSSAARVTLLIMHYAVLAFDAAICFGLFSLKRPENERVQRFPLGMRVLSVFGSRNNILGSLLDWAERQLGIDLRSTWALTVVRRSLEPLAISLVLAGWLSTSLTVVGIQDQGLVERLGIPVGGQPLEPGLHIHLPWPIDRVYRIPVKQIQSLTVGHEGQEEGGPENVLWAVEHAPNEYTLLLGNGRDLITIDAAVAFRITDARAWRYHSQNPADALKAIAYRAVMRNTVNRTLTEALSENVAVLTSHMRAMVQQDADALGLGVQVEAFTVGGMHPPVPVAPAYQAVVSAALGKVTAIVDAEAYRNQTVPGAESAALQADNAARAAGAEALATAAGQAWAFRTLESQYQASPQEYRFRRRLETLEKSLADRKHVIVDFRFLRDGGELWLTQ